MISEAVIWAERCAGKTGFEEKLTLELFEFGKGIDIIALETVEIGATMSDEVGFYGWGGSDGLADLVDRVLGASELFWGLSTEQVIIPLSTRDLIDSFIIETRIIFERRLIR